MTTVNGASGQNATTAGGGLTGNTSVAENFDNFLTLLTTQLQNQDPTSPLDTNEFTNQLVSFSQVEQALSTNSKLDQLIGLNSTNAVAGAVGYIGNLIEAPGNQLALQNGEAGFTYELAENSDATQIRIANEQGVVVRTIEGQRSAGRHEVTWDGLDDNGEQLPDGVYNLSVIATGADDQTVKTSLTTIGEVTGIEGGNGGVTLSLGDLKIALNDISAIRAKPQPAEG